MNRFGPTGLAGARHRPAIQESGCYWVELTCLVKVTHCGVVIFQTCVVVIALGQYRLAKIGLKSERGFGCLPRLFTQGDRWLKSQCAVAARIDV